MTMWKLAFGVVVTFVARRSTRSLATLSCMALWRSEIQEGNTYNDVRTTRRSVGRLAMVLRWGALWCCGGVVRWRSGEVARG